MSAEYEMQFKRKTAHGFEKGCTHMLKKNKEVMAYKYIFIWASTMNP